MSALWTLFAILNIFSLGFALLSLQRLYSYIKRYRFDESKYTLLFGFIHLHWITTSYIIIAAIWVTVTYVIFTLI